MNVQQYKNLNKNLRKNDIIIYFKLIYHFFYIKNDI